MDLRLADCKIDECIEFYNDVNGERLGMCSHISEIVKGSWGMYHNKVMYIIWCFQPDFIVSLINHEFMHGILDIIDGADACEKYHAIDEKLESWVET